MDNCFKKEIINKCIITEGDPIPPNSFFTANIENGILKGMIKGITPNNKGFIASEKFYIELMMDEVEDAE